VKIEKPLVIERTYKAPVSAVWQAISEKDHMKNWYFDPDEFQPVVGFRFQFHGKGRKGESYLHLCEVTEVIPGKKLQYSWRYEGYEGLSYVTFELFEEGADTRLKLTHSGLESFPVLPDFSRDSFLSGWTYLTGTALKDYLAKQEG